LNFLSFIFDNLKTKQNKANKKTKQIQTQNKLTGMKLLKGLAGGFWLLVLCLILLGAVSTTGVTLPKDTKEVVFQTSPGITLTVNVVTDTSLSSIELRFFVCKKKKKNKPTFCEPNHQCYNSEGTGKLGSLSLEYTGTLTTVRVNKVDKVTRGNT